MRMLLMALALIGSGGWGAVLHGQAPELDTVVVAPGQPLPTAPTLTSDQRYLREMLLQRREILVLRAQLLAQQEATLQRDREDYLAQVAAFEQAVVSALPDRTPGVRYNVATGLLEDRP